MVGEGQKNAKIMAPNKLIFPRLGHCVAPTSKPEFFFSSFVTYFLSLEATGMKELPVYIRSSC